MAYDPDEHGRIESLYLKYGARLQSEARSVRDTGRPEFAGNNLTECYRDALATAHAVYAYLLAHPVDSHPGRETRPRNSDPNLAPLLRSDGFSVEVVAQDL